MNTAADRGEGVAQMEPMLLGQNSPHRPELTDLALELAQKSAGLRRSLPGGVVHSLADLVRSMNCYYSNLIEGHDTHPVDIERAMREDYSEEPRSRNLQLEARAHVTVQQWIDTGGLDERATTADGICEVHRRFCDLLPDELLWVEGSDVGDVGDVGGVENASGDQTGRRTRVEPGVLRQRDVRVGRHIAVSAGALPRFLERFGEVYSGLGKAETVVSAAAAHHRLLWVHPFLDGNGRVARLISYTMMRGALDTGGIWSIARGLARQDSVYKAHLQACDLPRRNDLDGRGSLSEEALTNFTRFFLQTCIDQVEFMEALVEPNRLRERIKAWAQEAVRAGTLLPQADFLLEAVLYRGEVPRADVPDIVRTKDRQARRIVSSLIEMGALQTKSSRAPLKIAFPATLAGRWMPGLFPEV